MEPTGCVAGNGFVTRQCSGRSGFDPATRRFAYPVNPRFGSTSPALNTMRAPFRLTLDVSLDIAPSQNEQ
jgi:hypothetical protein